MITSPAPLRAGATPAAATRSGLPSPRLLPAWLSWPRTARSTLAPGQVARVPALRQHPRPGQRVVLDTGRSDPLWLDRCRQGARRHRGALEVGAELFVVVRPDRHPDRRVL